VLALSSVHRCVQLMLNHYQFLFLMRVADSVVDIVDLIDADAKHFLETTAKKSVHFEQPQPIKIKHILTADEMSVHLLVPTTGALSCYEQRLE